MCARVGSAACTLALFEGAAGKLELDVPDADGRTALAVACEGARLAVVRAIAAHTTPEALQACLRRRDAVRPGAHSVGPPNCAPVRGHPDP